MLISKLGEFGLIERLKKFIKTDASVVKGSGDDCAVINPALSYWGHRLKVGKGGVKFNKDIYLLFTCDMIVEGVDFTSKDKPYLVGRKALAVSISDIAACAGIPRYALLSLGIAKNTSINRVDMISKGIFDLARRYNINIVGGDISRARQLTIDVSMLGIVEKKYLVLRKGARKGDIIFVTGTLGGSIGKRHLEFIPCLKEARFLVKNFEINSMIDISDGLTQDLGHILKENNVGATIYEELIPINKDARNLTDALYRGEDFELLFTMSPRQAKKLYAKKITNFRPIGEIVDKRYGLRLVDRKGKEKIIKTKGYHHF